MIPLPIACKAIALPIELQPQNGVCEGRSFFLRLRPEKAVGTSASLLTRINYVPIFMYAHSVNGASLYSVSWLGPIQRLCHG